MNKYFLLLIVGAIMLSTGCAANADLKTDVLMAGNLLQTPAEVNSLLAGTQNRNVRFLDVRTPEEFEAGCLTGAENIDIKSGSFDQKIAGLDKSAQYLLYCRSGKRSADAANRMRQAGFGNISELEGGILAWQEAGLPLSQNCK